MYNTVQLSCALIAPYAAQRRRTRTMMFKEALAARPIKEVLAMAMLEPPKPVPLPPKFLYTASTPPVADPLC